jgi:hypothetical protein
MNLAELPRNQSIICIYGAGAVGLAVAADALLAGPRVAQSAASEGIQNTEIIYLTARNQLKSFSVTSPPAGIRFEHPISCGRVGDLSRILDGHVQNALPTGHNVPVHRSLQIQIVITTPPHHMDKAVNEILDWVTAKGETVTQKDLLIQMLVLCNGLLEPTTWERAICTNKVIPNFSTVRCIVVAGFAKEMNEGGERALVTHTAGREIHWGAIGGPSQIMPPALHGPLFDLIHHSNIRNLELQKFFTNAVLGWWIGNNPKNNDALTSILNQAQALVLASEFCQAFEGAGSAEELCKFLWHTVHTTAANVNSVSAAWCRGDRGLADYFRDTIEKRLRSSHRFVGESGSSWLRQFDTTHHSMRVRE